MTAAASSAATCMSSRTRRHRCPETRPTVKQKKRRCPKIPSTGKTVNGKHRQRVFPPQQNKDLTEEETKKPPKAPQGGKRPSKYDLAEDAKPLLLAYVGEDRELHQALGAFIELRTQLRAINSARAVKMLLGELDRLSEGRPGGQAAADPPVCGQQLEISLPSAQGGSPAEQSMPPQRWGWD